VKAVIEKEPVKEPVKRKKGCFEEKKQSKSRGDLCRGSDYYSVSKLSGTKLTGQIDLSQFNKPKRKRRA
jgi:hypothetical protein